MKDPREGVKPQPCPLCGHYLDAAQCISEEDARPKPNDVTLCIGCGGTLTWDDSMDLVPLE